ncbi:MAG: thiolase family protein [Dehalococcoidia bacterium]
MTRAIVAGVGMVPFGRHPDRTVADLGADAVVAALADAGITWSAAEVLYCGAAGAGLTPGTRVSALLGLTGLPVVNIDNASASGSSAFRAACNDVASGRVDVAVAVGVGKSGRSLRLDGGVGGPEPGSAEEREQTIARMQGSLPPVGSFAMRTRRRMHEYGTRMEQFALVAVKNRKHASANPYAQMRSPLTVEDVMAARMVADPLTVPHCCPVGDGGAAAVVVSEARARELGIRSPVAVIASAFRTPSIAGGMDMQDADTTIATCRAAYAEAGLGPADIDLVQVHDAFTVEEIEYCESMGFCEQGQGEFAVERGELAIGGRIPFSTDGGLLSRGHPLGPTGLAQVHETVMQIRGEAGVRQVERARTGLLHMVGIGGVCLVQILQRA